MRRAIVLACMLLAGPALLLLVWEAAARLGYLSPETLTAPSQALPSPNRCAELHRGSKSQPLGGRRPPGPAQIGRAHV